jgi:DNA-binding beta-propeller fold protein YncE
VLSVKRWALLALTLPLLAPGAASPRASGGGERIFVAAEDDGRLVAVDPETRQIIARLRVPRGPHNVALAPGVRLLLVTSPPARRVTLLESHGPRVLKVFAGFASPHDVEFSRDGRFAYVTEEQGDRVAVLSVARRRVVHRVVVGARPHDLAVGRGGRVWVTHGTGGRHVTVLDARRPAHARVVGRIPVAAAPHDITVSCGGRRVWLTYWNSGTVGAIDSRSGRRVFQRRLGTLVHHVQGAAGGRQLWITDHVGARARLLQPCTGRVIRTLSVGEDPHHVAVGPFRGHVVVASHSGTITILDPASERVRRLWVGHGLHGVAVAGVP